MSHMMFVNVLVCIFISFFKMMFWKKKKTKLRIKLMFIYVLKGQFLYFFLVKTYFNLVLKELKNKKIV